MYISKLHVCCHHSLLPIQAVGIHPDDLVSVLTFKDIVLQVEAYLTKSHSDIWDLDIVKWIQVSLEVIIVASDFQKAKDGDLDPLLKCAKALDQALNKMAEMEGLVHSNSWGRGCRRTAAAHQLLMVYEGQSHATNQ